MLEEIALAWCRGGRLSNPRPGIVLACLRMRSVGIFRGLDSNASSGQWSNRDMSRLTWAWAVKPLSEYLFTMRVRCSIPIWTDLSRIGGRPRLASFIGRCTSSMGKLGRRSMACRVALLSMSSMVVSCRSSNTPKCVAWYLDFRSCSTAGVLRDGLSLRLARVFAPFLTSLVMWMKCSRKSNMGLRWNPNIL